MENTFEKFNEHHVLHELKHFLPAQAPLKDFVHHNTLHAFQSDKWDEALRKAQEMFGYKVSLSLIEFRGYFESGKISEKHLDRAILNRKHIADFSYWKSKVLLENLENPAEPRIGKLRAGWKKYYKLDMDSLVHPLLFRVICSYLDQGISIWNFPVWSKGFLTSMREMETSSLSSFFKGERARKLLLEGRVELNQLLGILVGEEKYYAQYLFDLQFAHQGWSGMISTIENQPETLLDRKNITTHDFILFELLMEIDALDVHAGKGWRPLAQNITEPIPNLFGEVHNNDYYECISIFQEAFEWTLYDAVLNGIHQASHRKKTIADPSFQALFCIDDRECSLRRYVENFNSKCETFGTPGFFGVEFFYQPEGGKFYTKLCPAPVTPKYLIKEVGSTLAHKKVAHMSAHTHSLWRGWIISQTLGFWSAFQLFLNIFRPSSNPAAASSFKHHDKIASLTVENNGPDHSENGLQIGFTIEEMANRVEAVLKSIGLVRNFASVVYVVAHGSSSVNNPHYAAYDCGACCGRAGSVNARVFCQMANEGRVRAILSQRGLDIPTATQFVGALHDTTRDEMMFFDEDKLTSENAQAHLQNEIVFLKSLEMNAKERSRRFESINTQDVPKAVHEKVLLRSVSLFEPRPELNHATNAMCIVGRREFSKQVFLDRRSFLNSYDYQIDPEGKYLFNILKAAAPVCGGINLEYFFSRVDNQKLGAGTKLPHNVMGLLGVANGIDGDLRPGLPSQMIEIHDPVRLLIVVEHLPEVVLKTIQTNAETYEWFKNEWVHLVVCNPESGSFSRFLNDSFQEYEPIEMRTSVATDLNKIIESSTENLPVYLVA
jgi:uncharacterized protein YbcC (UPF0753/DUF2309 family)